LKSQLVKDLFYASVGRLSAVNLLRYEVCCRLRGRAAARWSGDPLVLHLGSGTHRIAGFVNIDGNPLRRPDLWLDIRLGLPFDEGSVDAAYCCHMMEHFGERDVRKILAETFRVLRPGHGLPLVTPDLRKAIEAYVRGDVQWFNDFPDRRRSLGGRFNNYLLCGDQHKLMFDATFLEEILRDIGFVQVSETVPHRSDIFEPARLAEFEHETPAEHQSLFVECFKPGDLNGARF